MTERLKMPKKPHKGLKIHCGKCNKYNSTCKHYDTQKYAVFVYVSGSKNPKIKTLDTRNYDEAVQQAIEFRKDIKNNTYAASQPQIAPEVNDYSLASAILKYNQYLEGNHELEQHKKTVSKAHRDECIRYCLYFADIVKQRTDINHVRVTDVNKYDVSGLYKWLEQENYEPRTFNRILGALKAFFDFLISVEDVDMKNPFLVYESKSVPPTQKLTLTRAEFDAILHAVDTAKRTEVLGGKGERKNFYRPYLKDGFRLGLLTGLRREEIVILKWTDIKEFNGVLFILVPNLKVNRKEQQEVAHKYVPINADLHDLLVHLGYGNYKDTDRYILNPDRIEKLKTIMDALSKGFTHFRKQAGITREISFRHLRKTYISWVDTAMGKETGILTSHASTEVLENHYLDPTILSAIEKGVLAIKIFGGK
ncbi:MAG: tyrosine-type recombinase/integrase [Bacteroidia bacterium]|nr:tyrosine-type recombinase/integrase [Bacteroidia bacterium]